MAKARSSVQVVVNAELMGIELTGRVNGSESN